MTKSKRSAERAVQWRDASALKRLFDAAADAHDGDYPQKLNAALLAVYDCGRREAEYFRPRRLAASKRREK